MDWASLVACDIGRAIMIARDDVFVPTKEPPESSKVTG